MKPSLELSLINCHAVGMDSIVFKESSPMIRAFVARPDHTLWRNTPQMDRLFSVAIHQHRQDITMVPVCGEICNVFFAGGDRSCFLYSYEYDSKILDGKGGFRSVSKEITVGLKMEPLRVPKFLRGEVFHSVYVPQGTTAAWLICEGAPNQKYDSCCFTNDKALEKADFSALYQPMTAERLAEDMAILSGKICGGMRYAVICEN